MELYTIRYNLHNYINKDNFDYTNTKDYIFLWKYTLITIFAFLGIIFIYKFKEIQAIGFMIIFIISLFIYIIYFEIGVLIDNIEQNKYLKEYGNYYELSNIIFNETYDFIEDNENLDKKNKITNINELLKDYKLEYLIINIDNEIINTNNFKLFIRDYIKIIILEEVLATNTINIKFDTIINNNKSYKIEDIFDNTSIINSYLINSKLENYYIQNNYLFINIDRNENSTEYNYFSFLIKYNAIEIKNLENKIIFTITNFNNQLNPNYESYISIINNYPNKKIYIGIDYNYLNNNKDKYYFNYFLQKIIIDIENDNSDYTKLLNKIKDENKIVNLKIKITEINTNDKINKNLYIKEFINNYINKINYSNKTANIFINYAQKNNKDELTKFLLEFDRIKGKIINNMKYEDNKTNEEINDTYYNQIKKNNDLLKYIDIYKLNYVNKFLFIKDNKNELENEPIIRKYEIEGNNKYYLIDLEELNKTNLKYKYLLLEYLNLKYEKKFKNFNLLFDNFDIRKSKGIKKIIDDYNYEFIKLIIISIIIITIICHIFYTELLRW